MKSEDDLPRPGALSPAQAVPWTSRSSIPFSGWPSAPRTPVMR